MSTNDWPGSALPTERLRTSGSADGVCGSGGCEAPCGLLAVVAA